MTRDYDDEYDDHFEVRDEPPHAMESPLPNPVERTQYRRRSGAREAECVKKAPLPFRVAAWIGVIAFCFIAGYIGTSLALRLLNRKDILLREDVAANRQQAGQVMAEGDAEIRLNVRKVSFTVYYPENGAIASERLDVLSGIMEDDIQTVLNRAFSLTKGKLPADVKLLNTFRSGDTLFLNFSSPFVPALSRIGGEESALLITSVVQTMKENFSPITKVRFLVDGRTVRKDAPVDLSVPWQLPQG